MLLQGADALHLVPRKPRAHASLHTVLLQGPDSAEAAGADSGSAPGAGVDSSKGKSPNGSEDDAEDTEAIAESSPLASASSVASTAGAIGSILGGIVGASSEGSPDQDWCPEELPAFACKLIDNEIDKAIDTVMNLPRLGTPPLSDEEKQKTLHSHSSGSINKASIIALVVILGFTGLGHMAGKAGFSCGDGCPPWTAGMIFGSYVLLVPGLLVVGFAFSITFTVPLMDKQIPLTQEASGEPGPLSESYVSLVNLLWTSGNGVGLFLVVLYAFFLPGLKLLLLVLGQLWRSSDDPSMVRAARRCIMFVQVISKWAAPDMFAFILLYFLFRTLYLPNLVDAIACLDMGFTFFSVFCVMSVLSTLAIKPPLVSGEALNRDIAEHRPLALRIFGEKWLVAFIAPLALAGFVFMFIGAREPMFGIRANAEGLLPPNGPLPEELTVTIPVLNTKVTFEMEKLLERVDIGTFINADVSLASCLTALARWYVEKRESNNAIALTMLGFFVVAFTLADFVFLIIASYQLRVAADSEVQDIDEKTAQRPSLYFRDQTSAMTTCYVLKHVAMLDVCLMGVLVVCRAAAVYKKQGVELHTLPGMYPLLACETLHYCAYYSLAGAVEHLNARKQLGLKMLKQ